MHFRCWSCLASVWVTLVGCGLPADVGDRDDDRGSPSCTEVTPAEAAEDECEWEGEGALSCNAAFYGASGASFYAPSCACFLAFSAPRAWADAEASCVAIGGHLASPSTFDENAAARAADLVHRQVWIGVTDIEQENQFVFPNGDVVTTCFFSPGEPNDYDVEDCVEFWDDEWNDSSCEEQKPYVCELRQSD